MNKNSETLLILGAVAVGGYLIYKSKIGETIAGVGTGISTAAGGLGEGIGQIGQSAGLGVADVVGILDILRPISSLGNQGAQNIDLSGRIYRAQLQATADYNTRLELLKRQQTITPVAATQAAVDIKKAELIGASDIVGTTQNSLRRNLLQVAATGFTTLFILPYVAVTGINKNAEFVKTVVSSSGDSKTSIWTPTAAPVTTITATSTGNYSSSGSTASSVNSSGTYTGVTSTGFNSTGLNKVSTPATQTNAPPKQVVTSAPAAPVQQLSTIQKIIMAPALSLFKLFKK